MSDSRKLIVKYSDIYNENKTKTISYANTAASDSVLLSFVDDSFNDLTTNTVIEVQKVDTTTLVHNGD